MIFAAKNETMRLFFLKKYTCAKKRIISFLHHHRIMATSSRYGCLACSTDLLPVLTSTTFPPCTHHVSSSLPAYIDLILFPYCFRIVSASGSENDRRTIGERYGIDTGSIRDWYETDTRTVFSDSHPKLLIRNLIFLSLFLLIIFYISANRRS